MVEDFVSRVDWLGHASFRIRGGKTIYFDPWKVRKRTRDGDIVLITHTHYDHHSPIDISKVLRTRGTLVGPKSGANELEGKHLTLLAPGEAMTVDGVRIEAVHAYNTNKKFHPRDNEWLGYIVELDGVRVYHAGDTDLIEEMNDVQCNIALLPVSGVYVMTAEEAIAAVAKIKPDVAIPMHWGDIVGELKDAELFEEAAACAVALKEPVA